MKEKQQGRKMEVREKGRMEKEKENNWDMREKGKKGKTKVKIKGKGIKEIKRKIKNNNRRLSKKLIIRAIWKENK